MTRTKVDHLVLRERAATARAGVVDGLGSFAERLAEHVRFEERELFACCEAELPEGVLDELAQKSQRGPEGARDLR